MLKLNMFVGSIGRHISILHVHWYTNKYSHTYIDIHIDTLKYIYMYIDVILPDQQTKSTEDEISSLVWLAKYINDLFKSHLNVLQTTNEYFLFK